MPRVASMTSSVHSVQVLSLSVFRDSPGRPGVADGVRGVRSGEGLGGVVELSDRKVKEPIRCTRGKDSDSLRWKPRRI